MRTPPKAIYDGPLVLVAEQLQLINQHLETLGAPALFALNRIANILDQIEDELHRIAGPDEFDKEVE
jgi:hypothetical protein